MIVTLKFVLTIVFFFFVNQIKASTWSDPTWKEMLDSSNLVAKVQYISAGKYGACAKIIKTFKGNASKGEVIYISGFSHIYGPVDPVHKGDTYIVFLRFEGYNDKSQIDYKIDKLESESNIHDNFDVCITSNDYRVWTPTSGDLKIEGKKIVCDLVNQSFYSMENTYSLDEFENFIKEYYKKGRKNSFCMKLLNSINYLIENNLAEDNLVAHKLMMIYLLDYRNNSKIYEKIVKLNNASSKYALIQIMGNIKSKFSRNILESFLKDDYNFIQGEAVKQLKKDSLEIVTPIFLKYLKSNYGVYYSPYRTDSGNDKFDQGKIEIIIALAELDVKTAIPDLLSILDSDKFILFDYVIDALKVLGNEDYWVYLDRHLKSNPKSAEHLISLIVKYRIFQCLPSLKNIISTCNRNNSDQNYNYISSIFGIGVFKDSLTIDFLMKDFGNFLSSIDTINKDNMCNWTIAYIRTFRDLKVEKSRPLIHESICKWFGINKFFIYDKSMFNYKRKLEDSLVSIFANKFYEHDYKLRNCMADFSNCGNRFNLKSNCPKFILQVVIAPGMDIKVSDDIITHELGLNNNNVSIEFIQNGVIHNSQSRFFRSFIQTPIYYFLDFSKSMPHQSDVDLVQLLIDYNLINNNYKDQVIKSLATIKEKLK